MSKSKKGFTLIEMMVSVALFSVVLTITLGSVMTIADSNKKARSLMSVTNNLNFAVDSMVRSFKSGVAGEHAVQGDCLLTEEINYSNSTSNSGYSKRDVVYCFDEVNGRGQITKTVNGDTVPLTSSDVDIDFLEFQERNGANIQPIIVIILEGTVKVSEKISSNFSIQTSVSQRKLNI